MNKIASIFCSIAILTSLASPATALQFCEIYVGPTMTGPWDLALRADRGEEFGNRTVNKWDDGDTCRSQGRLVGPNICQQQRETWYMITGRKNNGNDLDQETNPC